MKSKATRTILLLALAAAIAAWMGGLVLRYGSLSEGLTEIATHSAIGRALLPMFGVMAEPRNATGDLRPDLAFVDLEGHTRRLSEWDGKLVLVNFWATWCRPCVEEMPLLSAAQRRHGASGLKVLGVALDQPEAVRGWLTRHGDVAFPILLAADDSAPARALGNRLDVVPYTVLIGPDRRIRKQHLGAFENADELDAWLGR